MSSVERTDEKQDERGPNVWDDIGSQFKFEKCADNMECPEEMLGQNMHRWSDDEFDHLVIEMFDYTMMIVNDYQELFPEEVVVERYAPFRDDPRDDEDTEYLDTPAQPLQHIGGMLLWLARCLRADISFGTSCMCRRVTKWTRAQQSHLTHLIGYLKTTAKFALHMRKHHLDGPGDMRVVVETDADLRAPRSQSGWAVYAESDRGSYFLVAWASKMQPFCTDNTPAAELVAGHAGVKEALQWADHMQAKGAVILHKSDNAASIRVYGKGYSCKLAPFGRVLRLRISFMRDAITQGLVRCEHVVSEQNKANVFTKSLKRMENEEACRMLRILPFDGIPEKPSLSRHQGGVEKDVGCDDVCKPSGGSALPNVGIDGRVANPFDRKVFQACVATLHELGYEECEGHRLAHFASKYSFNATGNGRD